MDMFNSTGGTQGGAGFQTEGWDFSPLVRDPKEELKTNPKTTTTTTTTAATPKKPGVKAADILVALFQNLNKQWEEPKQQQSLPANFPNWAQM